MPSHKRLALFPASCFSQSAHLRPSKLTEMISATNPARVASIKNLQYKNEAISLAPLFVSLQSLYKILILPEPLRTCRKIPRESFLTNWCGSCFQKNWSCDGEPLPPLQPRRWMSRSWPPDPLACSKTAPSASSASCFPDERNSSQPVLYARC